MVTGVPSMRNAGTGASSAENSLSQPNRSSSKRAPSTAWPAGTSTLSAGRPGPVISAGTQLGFTFCSIGSRCIM